MQTQTHCKRCTRVMIVVDILPEGYDLICMRCGLRELIERRLMAPPPCTE